MFSLSRSPIDLLFLSSPKFLVSNFFWLMQHSRDISPMLVDKNLVLWNFLKTTVLESAPNLLA